MRISPRLTLSNLQLPLASWLKKKKGTTKVVIGRDARPSGEMVNTLVTSTLQALGSM